MEIVGHGCDIVSNVRIARLIERFGVRFLKRIYADSELKVSDALSETRRLGYLAKRFAAKEAIAKALGGGIGSDISFKEIEILNDERGGPVVRILRSGYNKVGFLLSMADEKEYSIASVVVVHTL
jgi:holo-[acyl-carrier protein] synthase